MVRMATAATETWLSAGVLRRRSGWESLGEGQGDPGGLGGRGSGRAWEGPGGRAREVRERPLLGEAGPRGRRTSEGEGGPSHLRVLSRDPHARAGKGLWACASAVPEKGARSPSVSSRSPISSPLVGVYKLSAPPPTRPPQLAKAGFSKANGK
ncbi:hypothetical protein D623_10011539 [Myotis brandtii]|uniref:Uncharacterized protein n=1 Tax=Myotis brandtii TaxID=109478 RepID=S7N9P0_MYOBR|nr:hypothetical protein D623_10011539 [Myotis brandtii]